MKTEKLTVFSNTSIMKPKIYKNSTRSFLLTGRSMKENSSTLMRVDQMVRMMMMRKRRRKEVKK